MKKQIKWNSGKEYDRSMYGSNDSTTPTPDSGLISFTAESSTASTKKLFKLKHCFDYYKDISDISNLNTITSITGRNIKDYVSLLDKNNNNYNEYWALTKDMKWVIEGITTLSTQNPNNAIQSWTCYGDRGGTQYDDWDFLKLFDSHNNSYFTLRANFASVDLSKTDIFVGYRGQNSVSSRQKTIYPSYSSIPYTGSAGGQYYDNGPFTPESYTVTEYYNSSTSSRFRAKAANLSDSDITPICYSTSSSSISGKLYNACKNIDNAYFKDTGTFSSSSEYETNISWTYTSKNGRSGTYSYSNSWTLDNGYDNYYKQRNFSDNTQFPTASKPYYLGSKGCSYKMYMSYFELTEPIIVQSKDILNNPNYYFKGGNWGVIHWYEPDVTHWYWRSSDGKISLEDTLIHEYCEPVICPYSYTYGSTIPIGDIKVKYQLSRPDAHEITDAKTIPIFFTKYKCEAYKKK